MSDGPTRGRFPALWPAEDVPDVAWTYWSLVDTMRSAPGMYGLDERRAKLHADLCRVYGLTRKQTLSVTDNLDRYETAVDMDIALRKVKANSVLGSTRAPSRRLGRSDMARMICDHAGKCCPCDCPAAKPHDCGKHGGGEVFKCPAARDEVRCVKAKEV